MDPQMVYETECFQEQENPWNTKKKSTTELTKKFNSQDVRNISIHIHVVLCNIKWVDQDKGTQERDQGYEHGVDEWIYEDGIRA